MTINLLETLIKFILQLPYYSSVSVCANLDLIRFSEKIQYVSGRKKNVGSVSFEDVCRCQVQQFTLKVISVHYACLALHFL